MALATIMVLVAVFAYLPAGSFVFTRGLLYVDCGGLDRETCEQSIDMFMPPSEGFLPDSIGFSIRPHFEGRPCGDYVLHGWFLGHDTGGGEPLC